ncbi:MAG TPA: hypothetical protein VEY30_03680 [Myxococcaceae bacterium]|nr:hypothetical protein [Myxococcaceae bacterium]
MNTRIACAFLVLSVLSGCVYREADDYADAPSYPGDVSLSWSFAGQTCPDVPEIQAVAISIPGEALANDGIYPCQANGVAGIVLRDFHPGHYTFTIDALGYQGERLFVGSGSFTVDGSVHLSVDLMPMGGPASFAYLGWRFPANAEGGDPSCESAGVTFVDVRIDNGPFQRYDCRDGARGELVRSESLEPGSHSIDISAIDAQGYRYYRYNGTLQTWGNKPVSSEYGLQWAVGGAAVSWTLYSGTYDKTCAQAGVHEVFINFQDASGQWAYGTHGDRIDCASGGAVYHYLQPGTYRVFISAIGSGGTDYLSPARQPPLVTVNEGVFPDGSHPVHVPLYAH